MSNQNEAERQAEAERQTEREARHVPTVHLGGTDPSELLRMRRAIREAASKLQACLLPAMPNGRDYCTQANPNAFRDATVHWGEMFSKASDIDLAMEYEMGQILDQVPAGRTLKW